MKGIILAGGLGTRLYPITRGVCKQLLPVYDKPMIYYPLSVHLLAGIKDILIISTKGDIPKFQNLIGDGSSLGIKISYAVQDKPKGLPEAFTIGKNFIGKDSVSLILGDNIIHGDRLTHLLKRAKGKKKGASIFAYYVKDPERSGVATFDKNNKLTSIEEKPKNPKSNWAVIGLYFFDNDVVKIASELKPSKRGELEITDVIKAYMKKGTVAVEQLGRGFAWLDTGTYDSLIDASTFIKTVQDRQGLKIGCVEEIAFNQGYINKEQLKKLAKNIKTDYGKYLKDIADGK